MSRSVIAVGVDDSQSSYRALAWAADEAQRRGSSLELITTWGLDHADLGPNALGPAQGENLQRAAEAIQQAAVDAVLVDLPAGVGVARLVVRGSPADALIDASRTADLVVVGSHGRSPLGSFLFGSVSRTLVKRAHCPVVVLPPSMTGAELDDEDDAAPVTVAVSGP
jgi:nucleotide-binding universal stress UspA family protein